MKNILLIGIILISSSAVFALPGDLDLSFGISGGYVASDFLGLQNQETANDIALQTDGKIVVAGEVLVGPNSYDFVVARYNVDGTLDATFSGDGIFTLSDSTFDFVNSIEIQSDGKIVAVGRTDSTVDMFVFRLNTNGTLDTTFSVDGKYEIPNTGIALSVAIQPSNSKIVIGGEANLTGAAVVVRLNTDGTLDTTLDTDGILTLTQIDRANGIAIQSNSRIVVAGTSSITAGGDLSAVRLLSNGTLDTSFDSDGIVQTAVYAGDSEAKAVLIQSDGKIVVSGGPGLSGSERDAVIVRYNSNGSLDTGFDSDGIKLHEFITSGDNSYNGLAQQTDGKILAIGDTTYGISHIHIAESFTLIRLNTDGTFDTTFDGNGVAQSQWCENGTAIAFQTDKIVAVGQQDRPSPATQSGFCTERFNDNGSVDTSFNFSPSNGKVIQNFTSVESIKGLPDGKMLVAGWEELVDINTGTRLYDRPILIRLNANGTLDTAFANEGVYSYLSSSLSTYFHDLEVLSDGKILIAGEDGNLGIGGIIIKLNPDGSPDTTFSGDGVASQFLNGATRFYSLTIQTDGKIVGCGSVGTGAATKFGKIVRFSAMGVFDASATVNFGTATANEVTECAVQTDGKIILSGYANDGTSDNINLERRQSNLTSLDTTFGIGGRVTTDLGATLNDHPTEMILQNDGKIVVSSTGLNGVGGEDFAVIRYNSDGTFDTNLAANFGSNGISLTNFGFGTSDFATSILVESDGAMIVGGMTNAGIGNNFAIAKLNPNGSERLAFGTLGRVITPFPNNDAQINALALSNDGKILAAGKTWNGTAYDFAIARYQNELAPSAATVSVSGRVSSTNGNGIRNVIVTLISPNGNILTTRTSTFGYFSFDEIPVGETYVISVNSKRFTFNPSSQILSVNEELTNVDFVAQE